MSLRFIVGRAGTGKTTWCLNQIHKELLVRPDGPSIILLVPEQATFQMERALVSRVEGSIRAHVYSFRRLAWRVLQESGGATRKHLAETGKRMVLRGLLEQKKGELKVFYRAARQPGFADSLARTITEMKMYRVTPQELEAAAASLQDGGFVLRDKLEDLALVYGDMEAFLAGRFTDPDDYLNLLAERLPLSPTCRGAEVWVDGFSGFTPQEYKVLEALMKVSARVTVALCCDAGILADPVTQEEIFRPTRETYLALKDLACQAGVEVEEPHFIQAEPHRFAGCPALAHLEKHFFHWPRQPFEGKVTGVKLVQAHNRRAEVEGAAREIISLCRDRGYRWRDISVLVRDITGYNELIERVFTDYGIPCFIDYKRPVSHHPLIELVRSALETVSSGWSYGPVFRYLKTGLVPVRAEEVDELENYVLAHGIRGDRWTDGRPWSYSRHFFTDEDSEMPGEEAEKLDRINRTRQEAVSALAAFSATIRAKTTVREISAAVCSLLTALGVRETLQGWSEEAGASGKLEQAREHTQIYNRLLMLMDEMVEALGDMEVSVEEYARILDAGLENLRMGLIPPGLDQVLVGTLDRSRSPEVKAAFLLGVNDGVLPARPAADGLLTGDEREALKAGGLNLAPGSRSNLFDEQYLVYLGLTRAREFLWVSYSLADQEGKGLNPSVVIAYLKQVLPGLSELTCALEPVGDDDTDLDFIAVPGRAASHLVARLRDAKAGAKLPPLWADVYNWLRLQAGFFLRRSLGGLFHQNLELPLSPATVQELYGTRLRLSISQVEQFISCPFSHFMQYGLRAKERETWKVRAVDLGRFFHAVLKGFVEKLQARGLDWLDLTEARCLEIVDEVVCELVPSLQNEIMMSSERQKYLVRKLKRVSRRSVLAMAKHTQCSGFRPVALELEFGGQPGGLKPLRMGGKEGPGLQMVGRIDRVDAARSGEEVYLRVIDYKSGSTSFKLDELYYGLRLQLLAYLDAALSNARALVGSEAVPGGMLYFRIKDPVITTDGPIGAEEAELKIMKTFKMSGLVLGEEELVGLMDRELGGDSQVIPVGLKKNGGFKTYSKVVTREQFDRLREHLRRVVVSSGWQILTGEVGIRPYRKNKKKACDYCRFRPACGFDPMISNTYRVLEDLDSNTVWQLLDRGDGGE